MNHVNLVIEGRSSVIDFPVVAFGGPVGLDIILVVVDPSMSKWILFKDRQNNVFLVVFGVVDMSQEVGTDCEVGEGDVVGAKELGPVGFEVGLNLFKTAGEELTDVSNEMIILSILVSIKEWNHMISHGQEPRVLLVNPLIDLQRKHWIFDTWVVVGAVFSLEGSCEESDDGILLPHKFISFSVLQNWCLSESTCIFFCVGKEFLNGDWDILDSIIVVKMSNKESWNNASEMIWEVSELKGVWLGLSAYDNIKGSLLVFHEPLVLLCG